MSFDEIKKSSLKDLVKRAFFGEGTRKMLMGMIIFSINTLAYVIINTCGGDFYSGAIFENITMTIILSIFGANVGEHVAKMFKKDKPEI